MVSRQSDESGRNMLPLLFPPEVGSLPVGRLDVQCQEPQEHLSPGDAGAAREVLALQKNGRKTVSLERRKEEMSTVRNAMLWLFFVDVLLA